MLNSKFLLATIAIICGLGGILAFKAEHRFNGKLTCFTLNRKVAYNMFYTTTIAPDGVAAVCTINGQPGDNAMTYRVTVKA